MSLTWETLSALVLVGSCMGSTIFWTALLLGRFQAQIQASSARHAESERLLTSHSNRLDHHDNEIRTLLGGRRRGSTGE